MEDKEGPFLRASWEPPRKADTRSGWITLIYELQVKLEGEEEWEVKYFGQIVFLFQVCEPRSSLSGDRDPWPPSRPRDVWQISVLIRESF